MGLFERKRYRDIYTYDEYTKSDPDCTPMFYHRSRVKAARNVSKIIDQELLGRIAGDSEVLSEVRDLALQKISDRCVLIRLMKRGAASMKDEKLKKRLDDCILEEIGQTTDERKLLEIASAEGWENGTNAVRMAAVDKIQSEEVLASIAKDAAFRYLPVKQHASERIKKLYGKDARVRHWTDGISN